MAFVSIFIMHMSRMHMPLMQLNGPGERMSAPVSNAMPLTPKRGPQQGTQQQDIQPARQA